MREVLTLTAQQYEFTTPNGRSYLGAAVVRMANNSGVELTSKRQDVPAHPELPSKTIRIRMGSSAAKRLIDFYGDTHHNPDSFGSYDCYGFAAWVADGERVTEPDHVQKLYARRSSQSPANLKPGHAYTLLGSNLQPAHAMISLETPAASVMSVWGSGAPLVISTSAEAAVYYGANFAAMMIRKKDGKPLTVKD